MLLSSLFANFAVVGFSGSRSLSGAGLIALTDLFPLITSATRVSVGCANGADAAIRKAFEKPPKRVPWSGFPVADSSNQLTIFRVSSGKYGVGKGAFVRRSIAIVESIPVGGLLVVVPGTNTPPAIVAPSQSFRGGGSGSWGSAAFALGTGRQVLLWLPSGTKPPTWSGVSWSNVENWWLGNTNLSIDC